MDAPKSVLFHWKYNNYEKDSKSSNPWSLQNLYISEGNMKNQKSDGRRMLVISDVFEEQILSRLQDKNQTVQECLYLLAFLDDFEDNNGRREMTYFENVTISKDV